MAEATKILLDTQGLFPDPAEAHPDKVMQVPLCIGHTPCGTPIGVYDELLLMRSCVLYREELVPCWQMQMKGQLYHVVRP